MGIDKRKVLVLFIRLEIEIVYIFTYIHEYYLFTEIVQSPKVK